MTEAVVVVAEVTAAVVVALHILTKPLAVLFFLGAILGHSDVFVFTPPKNWKLLAPQGDARYIVATYAAPTTHYPPSLSLATEPLHCTQKEYLAAAKKLLSKNATSFRKLSTQPSPIGDCHLFQSEYGTSHGTFTSVVAVFFTQHASYTLSFAARKEDIATQFPLFEETIKSIRLRATPLALLPEQKQHKVESACDELVHLFTSRGWSADLAAVSKKHKDARKKLEQLERTVIDTVGKDESLEAMYILREMMQRLSSSLQKKP